MLLSMKITIALCRGEVFWQNVRVAFICPFFNNLRLEFFAKYID